MSETIKPFDPKDFEPFNDFIPGAGYLLIRPFPEHVETGEIEPVTVRPIASNIVNLAGDVIEAAGKADTTIAAGGNPGGSSGTRPRRANYFKSRRGGL